MKPIPDHLRCGIYCIRNITTGKRYFGSTKNWRNRKQNHRYNLRYNKHDNPRLQNAWNKYGADDFVFEWYLDVRLEDLAKVEREFLKIGEYNINKDPERPSLGLVMSAETKEKIRQSQLGKKHTQEHKDKIAQAMVGEKNHFYGKTHSEETRKKIGQASIGRITPEIHAKMAASLRGKPWSEKRKAAQLQQELDKKTKGYYWSERQKVFKCFAPNGNKYACLGYAETEEEAIKMVAKLRNNT